MWRALHTGSTSSISAFGTETITVFLSALAVVVAAFCVWLTVRIVNRRERWPKRTLAAVIGFPVLYVASFGPACWLAADFQPVRGAHPCAGMIFYWPLGRAACLGPYQMKSWLRWWMCLGATDGTTVCVPTGVHGGRIAMRHYFPPPVLE